MACWAKLLSMKRSRKDIGVIQNRHSEVANQLADILALQAQGLPSRSEYEEKLAEVVGSLPRQARLAECELPGGRTRFVLREEAGGRVVGQFEFHHGHLVKS